MSDTHTKSIYLGPDGKLVVKDVTDVYAPQDSQSLVRVQYSGINPCDLNFFYMGMNSYVAGFELSGTVEQVGPTSPFKVGDAVCGLSPVTIPKPSIFGSHQELAIVEANLLFALPPGLTSKDASAITLVSQTATDALFNGLGFGFPAINMTGTDPTGHPILIWGGASSVGSVAIQMAKTAGFSPIYTTASSKNHAALEKLGATQCFDYKAPSISDDIQAVAAAQGVVLTTVFDTVGKGAMDQGEAAERSSLSLARRSISTEADPNEISLVCTIPVPTMPAFKFCASYRPSGNIDAMGGPQDPEAPVRVRKVMEYFLGSLERVVKPPIITVVKGAEAGISAIERVARGAVSMEKVVIEHPL